MARGGHRSGGRLAPTKKNREMLGCAGRRSLWHGRCNKGLARRHEPTRMRGAGSVKRGASPPAGGQSPACGRAVISHVAGGSHGEHGFVQELQGSPGPADGYLQSRGRQGVLPVSEARARAVRGDGLPERHLLRFGRGGPGQGDRALLRGGAAVPGEDGCLRAGEGLHEGHAGAALRGAFGARRRAVYAGVRPRDRRRQDAQELRPDRAERRCRSQVAGLDAEAARQELARRAHGRAGVQGVCRSVSFARGRAEDGAPQAGVQEP